MIEFQIPLALFAKGGTPSSSFEKGWGSIDNAPRYYEIGIIAHERHIPEQDNIQSDIDLFDIDPCKYILDHPARGSALYTPNVDGSHLQCCVYRIYPYRSEPDPS